MTASIISKKPPWLSKNLSLLWSLGSDDDLLAGAKVMEEVAPRVQGHASVRRRLQRDGGARSQWGRDEVGTF
jgi:hypothetical protein